MIKSFSNPRIKELKKLKKRSYRDEVGLFLIEGNKEISYARDSFEIVDIFFSTKHFLKGDEDVFIKEIGGRLFECDKEVFQKISYRDRPDGLIAVARKKDFPLSNLKKVKRKEPLFMVMESIEKPGNLGSVLRSSDCVGVDAFLVCDPVTDIYNPNVIRASRGAIFTNNIIVAKSSDAMDILKRMNIGIVAATPHAKLKYTEVDFKRGVAIVLGSEQYGLSDIWIKNCTSSVVIPMKGRSDSLNVSNAATVLMYEALRQRDV